ncbi:aminomethyl transferase family protein [Rhizobium laguerreae]|uniref:aminomethyl transferase family protein n=1 Tax=Rhizobium laguerreae TaxID=1076926 RepID=UPI001C9100C7|nr:aminomethyl transferase family protein [Rhizobium laguerreae]MBY3503277.1 aminomethyl transferase family protein [Rhizobium laguerreae]
MVKANGARSLQDLVDEKANLLEYFYNDTLAPHYRARTGLTAAFIPPEFTNWRDEQRAWRETAILFDQSHHMPELLLKGPDAFRLLEKLGINSLANFTIDRAKQFVACTPRGHVIGDCVVYRLAEEKFELISGMPVLNWVQFNAEQGAYDVTIERDDPTPYNPTGRRWFYRFQLEGPNAGLIFNAAVEGGAPEIAFFRTAKVKIGGCEVLVLRHGMAGHLGAELSGPYEDMERVRAALLRAGEAHGLKQGGTKTYFSTIFEFGWMPYPLPGIYTGEELRDFRQWLSGNGWEANAQLGGSFVSDNIEDYYVTPWDLGYGHILKFDHDFIGREALEALPVEKRRQKVTLVWNRDDVAAIFASALGDGPRYKAIDLPVAYYGWPQFDEVRGRNGMLVGHSCHCGYSNNEGEMLSLAMLDVQNATPGTEVTLTWGEPRGGSRKPHVERHEQFKVRAVVAPVPYASSVQKMKGAAIS